MSRWLIIGLSAALTFWLACVYAVWCLCRIAARADREQACAVEWYPRRNGRGLRPHAPATPSPAPNRVARRLGGNIGAGRPPLSAIEKRLDIAQGDWQEHE
jgi:hypothetical protein